MTAKCYRLLRCAWQRCIEDAWLNRAVQRFGERVSTQRLKAVTASDEGSHEIDAGMTTSWEFEHDAPAVPLTDIESMLATL